MLKDIKQKRLNLGLSQQELAKKAGISKSYLCELEKGKKLNASVDVTKKLLELLNPPKLNTYQEVKFLTMSRYETLQDFENSVNRIYMRDGWRVIAANIGALEAGVVITHEVRNND